MEKIINRVGLTVFASLKCIDNPSGKPLLHKDEYSLGRKCVWNYRTVDSMLGYLKRSTRPEIYMAVHQCAHFCNNPRLIHERAIRCIATTSRAHIHIRNYRMLIDSYLHMEYSSVRIKKNVSNFTWIPNLPEVGLYKILTTQKIPCCVCDT